MASDLEWQLRLAALFYLEDEARAERFSLLK